MEVVPRGVRLEGRVEGHLMGAGGIVAIIITIIILVTTIIIVIIVRLVI